MFWKFKEYINEQYAKIYCQFNYPKKSAIILYHGIDKSSCKRYNFRFISQKEFAQQIRFLKSKFKIVPIQAIFDEPNNNKLCAITFDDRYENWLHLALPIINSEKVPVTFFTSSNSANLNYIWTDFFDIAAKEFDIEIKVDNETFTKNQIGVYSSENGQILKHLLKTKPFEYKIEVVKQFKRAGFKIQSFNPIYWKVLDDKQVKELSKSSFVQIGSHCDNHNNLSKLSKALAIKELINSKSQLESLIQKEVYSIAYPDGDYDRLLIDEAEKIGYKYQLACHYLFNEDLADQRIAKRTGMYSHHSINKQLLNVLKNQ